MYRFISSILNLIIRKICKSLEVQGKKIFLNYIGMSSLVPTKVTMKSLC